MPQPRPSTPSPPRARRPIAGDAPPGSDAGGQLESRFAAVMEEFAAGGAWPGAVAVSGGGDSLALLHLIARWAKKSKTSAPLALVVDHGLRPHSGSQAQGVVKRIKALGLDAMLLRWKQAAAQKAGKGGIEAAARQARYRLMGEVLRKKNLATLYVGHTEDDQAETFLLRLARGSGLDGLSAMRGLAPWPLADFPALVVARPLLAFRRDELRAWLAAQRVAWLEDPMNGDPRFDRVKIRRLAPALAAAGLSSSRIALAARHMAAAREALELVTAAVLERAVRAAPSGGLLLDPAAMAAAPRDLSLRALAALLQRISGAPYRPRFAALERLHGRIVDASLGGGATLCGCRIAPAPARERVFGPATLKITREKPRNG